MTILGFDVAKMTVVVAEADRRATVRKLTTLENTVPVIGAFLEGVKNQHPHLTVIAESTGDYHRPLLEACLARGIDCRLVNPILTKQFNRATVRRTKTDRQDAVNLVKLAIQGEGRVATAELLTSAKPLVRTAARVGKLRQSLKAITNRFDGIVNSPTLTASLTKSLHNLTATMTALRTEAQAAVDPTRLKLLTSIPGIGEIIGTTLLAELSPIERFTSERAVVAYAGLDPRILQSGMSLNRMAALTKRGSPHLRHMLFIAASSARRCDPALRTYYEKKRKEGKSYRTTVIAISRKLVARIYAVWKRGTPYLEHPPKKTT